MPRCGYNPWSSLTSYISNGQISPDFLLGFIKFIRISNTTKNENSGKMGKEKCREKEKKERKVLTSNFFNCSIRY